MSGRLPLTRRLTFSTLTAISFTWLSCGLVGDVNDPGDFSIISRYPDRNYIGVSWDTAVSIEFSRQYDPLSIRNETLTVRNGTEDIEGTFSFASDTVVEFQPRATLAPISNYNVHVSTDIRALDGTPLVRESNWSFTTTDRTWEFPTVRDNEGDALGSTSPRVAMSANGSAFVLWTQNSQLWVNRWDPNSSSWEGPFQLGSPGAADDPRGLINVDNDGNAIASWKNNDDVVIRRYDSSLGWESELNLSNPHTDWTSWHSQAVSPGGYAIISWVQHGSGGDYELWGCRFAPETGWSAPEAMGTIGEIIGSYSPLIALDVDDDGRMIATWTKNVEGEISIWGSVYEESWSSSAVHVQGQSVEVSSLHAWARGDGSFRVAWEYQDGSSQSVGILVTSYQSHLGWGVPSLLNANESYAYNLVTDFRPDGLGVIAWFEATSEEYSYQVHVRTYTTDSASNFKFSDAYMSPFDLRATIDGGGRVTVVWADSSVPYVLKSLRKIPGAGWWSDTMAINENLSDWRGGFPAIASASPGDVLLAWRQENGSGRHVFTSFLK